LSPKFLLCPFIFILCYTANTSAQQAPSWRVGHAISSASLSGPSVRIGIKEKAFVEKNILELGDIAELTGPEEMLQNLRSIPLGPGPSVTKSVAWTQNELLRLLELRGIEAKSIRWAGANSCQISHHQPIEPSQTKTLVAGLVTPQTMQQAERVVAGLVSSYLLNKASENAGWIVEPIIPESHAKLLAQRLPIKGIAGGEAPWTGRQRLTLLVTENGVDTALDLEVDIRLPPTVVAVIGPTSKGRVLSESDLKTVKLTPSMQVDEADCFVDPALIVGKELRRNLTSGRPIQRSDIGPPRIVQAKDLVKIQVVSGFVVAETNGRSLQAGGVDEIVEVEVVETKKRLAARVISSGVVEIIAR
jgi:flagella basal body P-ring formation protein FlgA